MAGRLTIIGVSLALLSGCGGTLTGSSRAADPMYFIGALTSDESGNGLEFAGDESLVADAENVELQVKLARFVRDTASNEIQLIVSNESVTVPDTFTTFVDRDISITIEGDTLTFVDGRTTLASGQPVWSYYNYGLEYSGTGGIYTYGRFAEDFENPIDMEGFYAIGFETDPSELEALGGRVTYLGSYFGYGQTTDLAGNLLNDDVQNFGAVVLEANFGAGHVNGRLDGRLDPTGEDYEYELVFLRAPIVGNGFVGAADMACPSGSTCQSGSFVGGAFFGPDGAEVSGVIGFDELIEGLGDDGQRRFIGTAGFSSAQDVD